MSTNNTKQALWVSLGSLFSFGFSIVSSMILSRYFSKTDYGTYKQVIYVYSTLLAVFTLGLPKAYSFFLPRVDINQAKSLITKINRIFILLGAVFSILLFVFSPQIAIILKNPELTLALKIFSPVPLLMLPTMGLEGILATYKKTQFLAFYTVTTRILMLLCVALPVVIFHLGYIQAIIGFVVASLISFLLALYFKYYPVKHYRKDEVNISYKEIFKFSIPLLYASIWGTIIASSDQFFVSRYYGTEKFAEFANGFMQLPFVGMIIGACSTVLSPIFSKQAYDNTPESKKEMISLWRSVFNQTAMLIYPLVVFCIFYSNEIIGLLYGAKYVNAGLYFKIRLFLNFFTLIAYGPLIISIGKTKLYSNVHMFTAFILVILEYIAVQINLPVYSIAVISVLCNIGKILCLMAIISKYLKISFSLLFTRKAILLILFPSIIIMIALKEIFLIIHIPAIMEMILCGIIFFIIYILWSFYSKLGYIDIIKKIKH